MKPERMPFNRVRPPRILHVEGNVDGTVGGSHRALYDLVKGLDRRRFDPVPLFYQDNPFASRLAEEGVEVVRFDQVRAAETAARGRSGPIGTLVDVGGAVMRRRRLIRELGIDLVHLNNSPFQGGGEWIPAARLAGVPIVASSRGNPRRPVSASDRFLARRFDRVVPVSAWVRDGLLERGIRENRIRLVYDGVDTEAIRSAVRRTRAETRASLEITDESFVIIMVGNLRSWKGQHVLIEAASRLPRDAQPVRVLFAGSATEGDTAYVQSLRDLVKRHGLEDSVGFLGHRDDVPDLLHMADVAVHASTDPEPFGLVVPEAMAIGTAVVVSRFGGPGEVLCEGAGFLHDPSDPSELAGVLMKLMRSPELRTCTARAALEHVETFNVARTVERMQAVYCELLWL